MSEQKTSASDSLEEVHVILGGQDSASKTTPSRAPTDIITLNVGGTLFQTTVGTLLGFTTKQEENITFFSALLSTDPASSTFFIDRSPEYFRVVLDFLRCGELWTSGLPESRVRLEFAYFGLMPPFPDISTPSVFQRWLTQPRHSRSDSGMDCSLAAWMLGLPGECRQFSLTPASIMCDDEYVYVNSYWRKPFDSMMKNYNSGKIFSNPAGLGAIGHAFLTMMGRFGWELQCLTSYEDHQTISLQYRRH